MKKRGMAVTLLLCLLFHTAALAEGNKQTLHFAWWGNAEMIQTTQAAVDEFVKARRRTVAVDPHAVGTRDAYVEWLSGQFNAGAPGDVVELDAEMFRTLARNANGSSRLMDLEIFVKRLDLTQFSYFGLISCLIDDRVCAIPISMSSHVFFWNTTALKERKVSMPENNAELLTLAASLRDHGMYPLAASAESRIALLITWLQSKYGQPWISQATGEVSFMGEQVAEGLRYLDLFEKGGVWPKLAEQGNLLHGWREGRYAGVWAWDTQAAELNAVLPADAKMETTARLLNWSPYGGGFQRVNRMLAIPKSAREPLLAAEFIEFLLNSEKGAVELKDLRGTPISRKGAYNGTKKRALNRAQTVANETALSWARYLMPPGFDAPGLVGAGGVYEQVLTGYSAGLMTDEAAAYALISGIHAVLHEDRR